MESPCSSSNGSSSGASSSSSGQSSSEEENEDNVSTQQTNQAKQVGLPPLLCIESFLYSEFCIKPLPIMLIKLNWIVLKAVCGYLKQ